MRDLPLMIDLKGKIAYNIIMYQNGYLYIFTKYSVA